MSHNCFVSLEPVINAVNLSIIGKGIDAPEQTKAQKNRFEVNVFHESETVDYWDFALQNYEIIQYEPKG